MYNLPDTLPLPTMLPSPRPASSASASSSSAPSSSASSSSSSLSSLPPSSSALSFAHPDPLEVRKQLFGIMLCDQLEASNSVSVKTVESRKRKRDHVPPSAAACFQGPIVAADPVLRLALFHDAKAQKTLTDGARAVVAYVQQTSPNMPIYIRDAYTALQHTKDHILQLASLYFFVYWHVHHDPLQHRFTLVPPKDDGAARLLCSLGFDNNQDAMANVHEACTGFERGRGDVSTMMSFVHTLVCTRWKKIAVTPGLKHTKRTHGRSDDNTTNKCT